VARIAGRCSSFAKMPLPTRAIEDAIVELWKPMKVRVWKVKFDVLKGSLKNYFWASRRSVVSDRE
jgi:hypothetical protein